MTFELYDRKKMKKISICSFLILLILSVASSCLALSWKTLHERADKINLEQALGEVKDSPHSVERLYVLGLVHLNRYETQQARKAFERILDINSEVFAGQWGIAEVLRREHKLDESKQILEKLLREQPRYAPTYLTRAYICYIDLEFKRGVNLSHAVLNLGEKNVDLTNIVRAHALFAGCKGMLAHHGGPWAKVFHGSLVKRHLRIASELKPDDPSVCVGLGSYYMLIPKIIGQDLVKAEAYFKKAIMLDPNVVLAYVRLAQVYQAQGDLKMYEEYIQKADAIDPEDEILKDIKSNTCKYLCVDSE